MDQSLYDALLESISNALIKIIPDYGTQKALSEATGVSEKNISLAKKSLAKKKRRLLSLPEVVLICEDANYSANAMLGLKVTSNLESEQGQEGGIKWRKNPVPPDRQDIEDGIKLFEIGVKHIEEESAKNDTWYDYKRLYDDGEIHKLDAALRSGAIQLTYVPQDTDKERDLRARFNWLNQIRVVKLTPDQNGYYSDANTIKSECAAFLASQELNKNKIDLRGEVAAFGQGYTVRRMVAQSPHSSELFRGTKWVSIVSERIRGYGFTNHTASSIVADLATRNPGSEPVYLPYYRDSSSDNYYKDEDTIHTLQTAQENIHDAKILFTTINSLKIDDFRRRGEPVPSGIRALTKLIRDKKIDNNQAIALYQDMILNVNGEIELNDPDIRKLIQNNIYAIEQSYIDTIGDIHNTWLLAIGAHKKEPVLSMLRSPRHLLNSIIIDSEIAEFVINETPL